MFKDDAYVKRASNGYKDLLEAGTQLQRDAKKRVHHSNSRQVEVGAIMKNGERLDVLVRAGNNTP